MVSFLTEPESSKTNLSMTTDEPAPTANFVPLSKCELAKAGNGRTNSLVPVDRIIDRQGTTCAGDFGSNQDRLADLLGGSQEVAERTA